MWSGEEDKVPDGWALCDGKTAGTVITPDLRNKFIMGWNPSRSGVEPDDVADIGDEGPEGSHYDTDLSRYLTSEPTALTAAQIPELEVGLFAPKKAGEEEAVERKMYAGQADNGNKVNNYTNENWGTDSDVLFKTKGTKGDAHSHKLVAHADKGKFDKRPEWYALAFIMYTGVFKL